MAKKNTGMILILGAAAAAAFAISRKKGREGDTSSPSGLLPRPDSEPSPPVDDEETPLPDVNDDPTPEDLEKNKDADLPMPKLGQQSGFTKSSKLLLPEKESAEDIKGRCENFLGQMLDENGVMLDLARDTAYAEMIRHAADLLDQGEHPLNIQTHGNELSIAALDELIPGCDFHIMNTGVGPLMVFGPANTIDQRIQYVHQDLLGLSQDVVDVMNAFHAGDAEAAAEVAEYGIERIN